MTTLGQGLGYEFVPQHRAAALQREEWLTIDQLTRWLGKFFPASSVKVVPFKEHNNWLVQYIRPAVVLPLHDWLVYHKGKLTVMDWREFAMFRGGSDDGTDLVFVEPLTAASSVSNEELASVIKEERETAVRDALFAIADELDADPSLMDTWVVHRIRAKAESIGTHKGEQGEDRSTAARADG